jgi:rhamnosyltransferase
MAEHPSSNTLCAIITTYRPSVALVQCVQSIQRQVNEIVIIDDGDSQANVAKLHAWFGGMEALTILHQPKNFGIAAALNRGVEHARPRGYQWLLTLDEDSIPQGDMVSRLCCHLVQLQSLGRVGCLGMGWQREEGRVADARLPRWREKRGIITSGSLFSLAAYDAVGGFREEFFIDCVDYDFCLRLRTRGYRIIQILEYGFQHSLGVGKQHRLLGFTIDTYRHDPQRLYYLVRNSIVLALEYICADPLYTCAVGYGLAGKVLEIVLWKTERRQRFKALICGVADGLRHRMGRRILNDHESK